MLIIGPPGVGKSEQAKRIADYYDDAVALGPIDSVLSWAVAEGKAFAEKPLLMLGTLVPGYPGANR